VACRGDSDYKENNHLSRKNPIESVITTDKEALLLSVGHGASIVLAMLVSKTLC